MNANSFSPQRTIAGTANRRRWPRLAAWIATALWAGAWSAFVLVDGLADAAELGPTTYLYVLGFLIAFWGPTWLGWRRPWAGAVALACVGLVALVYFDYPGVRWILAAPPLVLSVAHAAVAWSERRNRTIAAGERRA